MEKMNLNIETMSMVELKTVIKVLIENFNHEHDRLTVLQDRVLKLELFILNDK